MAGHSKWANIKHRKASQDATVSAREGGDDLNSNSRLRTAVNKARENNMPNDNIERAIKKGTGALDGSTYEEIRYEGYGPGGVAIMVDVLTDNKNRTMPEIRTIFSKNNGNLGENGCVSYLFDRKGIIIIDGSDYNEDDIMENLLEYDIEDIKTEDSNITVTMPPESFNDVLDAIKEIKYPVIYNDITFVPQTNVPLDEQKARQCMKLIDLLDEHDDVQNVYSNYDISDEVMTKLSEEQ